jgi:hypothetical protein
MAEERKHVVSRREPITTTVVQADGTEIAFKAHEIPRWRARNDLANEVVHQYTNAMNGWLHSVQVDNDEILLQGDAFEALIEYDKLFLMGYGSYDAYDPKDKQITPPPADLGEAFERLDFAGMIAVLNAALEINGLERQQYMLDRSKKDPDQQTLPTSLNDDAGQKMESSPASG